MKKSSVFIPVSIISMIVLTLICGGAFAAAKKDSSSSSSSAGKGERLVYAVIPAPSLEGNKLGDPAEQPVIVYLPPSYFKSQTRFPVVYFLPGYGDTVDQYTNGTYDGFTLKEAMDELIAAKKVKEMAVVIVNGYNKLGGCFYHNSPVAGNWEDFVVKDAVGFVDSHYRTLKDPLSRGLSGHSMGGFGALHLAMRHPGVFSCVYGMSPALFDAHGAANALAQWKAIPDWGRYVIMAVSACFSPNLSAPFPYADIPADADDPVLQKWDKGMGDIAGKVRAFKDGLKACKTIGLEVGSNDEYLWILDGTRLMKSCLESEGIVVTYSEFDGKHFDVLGERLKNHMLPFMSASLKFE